jgi:serine protein kinase
LADSDLFSDFMRKFDERRQSEISLEDYLIGCRKDPLMYATAAERLLAAIGEPQIIDTAQDQRLGRIFMNRTIRLYPSFTSFYGMEQTIEQIVAFLRHASQGLEERKQILYLLGPVGAASRRWLSDSRR